MRHRVMVKTVTQVETKTKAYGSYSVGSTHGPVMKQPAHSKWPSALTRCGYRAVGPKKIFKSSNRFKSTKRQTASNQAKLSKSREGFTSHGGVRRGES
jgi:hypothetical protein